MHELKNERQSLNSQLLDAKDKLNEMEILLHENKEKQLVAEEQRSLFKRQLREEQEERSKIIAAIREESESQARIELKKVIDKNQLLENEKEELIRIMNKSEDIHCDLTERVASLKEDKIKYTKKEKELLEQIKK